MGAQQSRRRAERNPPSAAAAAANIEHQASPHKDTDLEGAVTESAQEKFVSGVTKMFRKKVLSFKHRRVEINGKADQYPYWMSTHNLQKHSGDHNKNTSNQKLRYHIVQSHSAGNKMTNKPSASGKVPSYLYHQLQKTMKLQLRYKKCNMTQSRQQASAELGKLKRSLRTLYLNLDYKRVPEDESLQLNIKLYEQHVTARKATQLRPMICEDFFYDEYSNIGIMGEEFLLIVNKPDEDNPQRTVQGVYLRSLDTSLHGIMMYHVTLNDSCDIQLPKDYQQYDEYAKLLLSKSTKEFSIRIPKLKKANC